MTLLKKIKKLGLIILMWCMPALLKAQGGFDDNTLDNPVPFDDGVYFLVAVAVAYGLRIAYTKKKMSVKIAS
jgi:hypothetical protein